MADNVRAQHRLLTGHFGVTRVAAAYGFSMGAGQAYHWAALFGEFVERAIVVCGSARTSVHSRRRRLAAAARSSALAGAILVPAS